MSDGVTGQDTLIHTLVIIIMTFAIAANGVLLTAIVRSPTLLATTEIILNLNLTVSDILFAIALLVTHVAEIVHQPNNIFADPALCTFQAIWIQSMAICSTLTLLAISACNYWLIVMEKSHPTKKQLAILLLSIWALTIFWGFIPVMSNPRDGYTLQPSAMYCGINFFLPSFGSILVRFLNLCLLAFPPTIVICIYFFISRKLWLINRELIHVQTPSSRGAGGTGGTGGSDTSGSASQSQAGQLTETGGNSSGYTLPVPHPLKIELALMRSDANTGSAGSASEITTVGGPKSPQTATSPTSLFSPMSPSSPSSQLVQSGSATATATGASSRIGKLSAQLRAKKSKNFMVQVAIIKRAILIAGSFMVAWTFYLVINIMQTFSGVPVSPLTDGRSIIFLSFNPLLNPLILLWLDKRYKESLKELLGITNRLEQGRRAASSGNL